MRLTPIKLLLPCVALALAWSGSARADMVISLAENGGTPVQVASGPSGTFLTISGTNAGAPEFTFAGFTVTPTMGASEGELQGTGTIIDAGGPASLTITVSDDGFTNPTGPDYKM